MLVLLAALCLAAEPSPAADAPVAFAAPSPRSGGARARPLVLRPAADITVTAILGAGWLVSEVALKKPLAPATCRWCAQNGLDVWASGIRAPLELQSGADVASGVFGFAAMPLATLGVNALVALHDNSAGYVLWDALLLLEATFAALAINQTVKFLAGRERPFASRLDDAGRAAVKDPADSNLSFFSGHTTFGFALATAAGTIAKARGYRLWWLTWAIGYPIATLTAVLRMVADKHWLTDVLVGAAVGAGVGWAIPALFHPAVDDAEGPRVMLSPLPMGLAVTVRL